MPESFRDEIRRMKREAARHIGHIVEAFRAAEAMGSTAIRGTGYGKPMMVIESGELVDRDEGSLRLTFFGHDGPHGHATRRSHHEIVQEAARVLEPKHPVEAMSEAEVMAWTTSPEFELGSRVVAYIQAENAFRYYAGRAKRSDWAQEIIRHANDVGTAGGTHRGTVETVEAATKILTDAMHDLPTPNARYRPNPAWVTSALASSYTVLEEHVPAKWLPKLDHVKSRDAIGRSRLVAEMPELGCGAYGCVLDTLDPGVVLKVTTDPTEAEFAIDLADSLVAPICVDYQLVMRLAKERNGNTIYLLWREAAEKVGGLEPHEGIEYQHTAAQIVYAELMEYGEASPTSLKQWRGAVMTMGNDKRLAELAAGLVEVYEKQHIFFGDLHAGNLGLVTRDGKKMWVITDPGHVAVVEA